MMKKERELLTGGFHGGESPYFRKKGKEPRGLGERTEKKGNPRCFLKDSGDRFREKKEWGEKRRGRFLIQGKGGTFSLFGGGGACRL